LSSASIEIAQEIATVAKPHQFFCEMNTSGCTKENRYCQNSSTNSNQSYRFGNYGACSSQRYLNPFLAAGEYASEFWNL
jgi:hypothetical protein